MAAVELNSTSLLNDPTLRAYYRAENVNDTTINSYTLTNNNSVAFNAAKFNNGADFGTTVNGTKSLSINSDIGITSGNITISCWVKLATEIAAESGYYYLVNKSSTTNVAYIIRYAYNSGSPRLEFIRSRVGTANDQINYTVTLGTTNFYHLVLTYDGSYIRAYVNGSQVGSDTASTGTGASGGVDKLYIGATIPGSSTTTELFTASTTWTCPDGVSDISIECWGAGGGGADGGGTPSGGDTSTGGGGGGAYSKKNSFTVSPGTGYTVSVGTAGAIGGNGSDTYFKDSSTVLAKGGTGGTGAAGGTGGQSSSGVGDTKYSGGNGAFGDQGGGGGSAGPLGAGSNGGIDAGGAGNNSNTAGVGIGAAGNSNVEGGSGGGGSDNNAVGGAGGVPGGGGGAGEDNGAAGGRGQVRITYMNPTYETLGLLDDVAIFNSALSSTTVSALYNGTLSAAGACGLDKLSTSATYQAVWTSKVINIGKEFILNQISIPLAKAIDATTSIEVRIFVDGLTSYLSLPVINSTNFGNRKRVIYKQSDLADCIGENNFYIRLVWSGTTEMPILMPIDVDVDVRQDDY